MEEHPLTIAVTVVDASEPPAAVAAAPADPQPVTITKDAVAASKGAANANP